MLINYFGWQFFNVKHISNFFKKSHNRKDLLSSKFSDKYKHDYAKFKKVMVNCKNLLDKLDHFFLWPYLHQECFVSNNLEKVVDLNTLNILITTRAMLMNVCLINTLMCQILIWVCKVLCFFQQIFTCEKVKGNIIKR